MGAKSREVKEYIISDFAYHLLTKQNKAPCGRSRRALKSLIIVRNYLRAASYSLFTAAQSTTFQNAFT